MCDTLVALPGATADGSTILAKNSDREPNEAQAICFHERQEHAAGAMLQCTYITIPQARETHAVLLSLPFWMWGAEMGANEHGVVIGNEAVFARVKVPATGLTGMDLLRLGLERAASAERALEVITDLLAAHGQGGSGGYQHKLTYHNSFIIADRQAAWVLETVDRHWAARRVHDVASISNGLTIGGEFDLSSPDLVGYAVKRGWCRGRADFDFARCYADFIYTRFSGCRARQPASQAGLRAGAGRLDVGQMAALLRSHGIGAAGRPYDPAHGANDDICMHFAGGPIRSSQTTGSLVAHLRGDGGATFWLTGAAAPCLGVFKPFFFPAATADWAPVAAALGPLPTGRYDPAALWWQSERLHRAILADYRTRSPLFRDERDLLEAAFLADEAAGRSQTPAERAAFSARCVAQARAAVDAWTARAEAAAVQRPAPWLYRRQWAGQSRAAGLL